MLSTVSLDECIQTAHCSNNSQSVYISTKPSLVCSSNRNSAFRHFINTADLFLIKEFHSSEVWSLNISDLKTSLLQHAKRLFSIYFILCMSSVSPQNATLPADDAQRGWQRWPSLRLCKKAVPVTQENEHRDTALRANHYQFLHFWEILYLLRKAQLKSIVCQEKWRDFALVLWDSFSWLSIIW